MAGMGRYTRPQIEDAEFRDASGQVISFGNRWANREASGPPEDSYSVDEHTERFAPLHVIAEALISHLIETYDVTVNDKIDVVADLPYGPRAEETVRAVRFTPRDTTCAPLTLVLTTYPSVHLHAGVLFSTGYPSCGCNACDETWQSAADELEWQVFAITGGGFSEAVSEPRRPKWSFSFRGGLEQGMGQTVSHRLRALDGSTEVGGESRADVVPAALLNMAQSSLEALASATPGGTWQPWPKTPIASEKSQEDAS